MAGKLTQEWGIAADRRSLGVAFWFLLLLGLGGLGRPCPEPEPCPDCPECPECPPPPPCPVCPVVPAPELAGLVCNFSDDAVAFDEAGSVFLWVTGQYRGPATFIQARLTIDAPGISSAEAVSFETHLAASVDFQPFGPIVTGNFTWDAGVIPPGTYNLLGRLVETDGAGTILRDLFNCSQPFTITGPPPVLGSFRQFAFSRTFQPSFFDVGDAVSTFITLASYQYNGPATRVWLTLVSEEIELQGLQAVSAVQQLPDTGGQWLTFGPLVTGRLSWPACTFQAGTTIGFSGALEELDAQENFLRRIAGIRYTRGPLAQDPTACGLAAVFLPFPVAEPELSGRPVGALFGFTGGIS